MQGSDIMQSSCTYLVMVIDDDDDIRAAIARILSRCDCKVTEVCSVEEAIEQLKHQHFDVIFSDLRFGEDQMGGEDLLNYSVKEQPLTKVVLMSSVLRNTQIAVLKEQGAAYCLQKPFFQKTCMEVLENIHQKAA